MFNMEKSSLFHRTIRLLVFVLVIVLIFVINNNFKWKQQTRREGQSLNDDFSYHYQFLLS